MKTILQHFATLMIGTVAASLCIVATSANSATAIPIPTENGNDDSGNHDSQ